MSNSITNISHDEIMSTISNESLKFKNRVSKVLLGKKISKISYDVLKKVDQSTESNENIINVYVNHFSSIVPFMKPEINQALENGGIGNCFAEELCSMINKYVSQESNHRVQLLKTKHLINNQGLGRKEIINDIVKAFESNDLNLFLSESFNQEFNGLLQSQENEIIDETVTQVSDSIAESIQKADATRVIMNEFQQVAEKAKSEQDAMKPEEPTPEQATESSRFNSTEYIKSIIPVSVERFKLQSSDGAFTRKNIIKMLVTLEENSDSGFANDKDYISKRIDMIKQDAVNVKDFDVSKVNDLEQTFKQAVSDMDTTFSAFKMLSFSGKDLPAFKTDEDTLNAIRKLSDLKSLSDEKRINEVQILIQNSNKNPITTPEQFLFNALESYMLRAFESELSVDTRNIIGYDDYRKSVEIRDELAADYLIDGMKHVPEARAERLKEINNGLRKLASNSDVYDEYTPKRMKSIFYKTAQIVNPGVFVDFKSEADRVKNMISDAYKTDKYDSVVDDFFNENYKKSSVSSENYYELSAFSAALKISKESDISVESNRTNIKKYATVSASYLQTIKNLGIVDRSVMKNYIKEISNRTN